MTAGHAQQDIIVQKEQKLLMNARWDIIATQRHHSQLHALKAHLVIK
jgi:hypothetical protein